MACENTGFSIVSRHHSRNPALFLRLLIILFLRLPIFVDASRSIPIPKQPVGTTHDFQKKGNEEAGAELVRGALIIGSMPPRCDRKCESCGRCEAVQVPITPSSIKHHKITGQYDQEDARAEAAMKDYWRGDGLSNYKPMCWKCKCGNLMFNP